jgi:hypothetical protein
MRLIPIMLARVCFRLSSWFALVGEQLLDRGSR